MAVYKATAPAGLIKKIADSYSASNRAAAQALNKTATFAVEKSIQQITSTVNLKPNYLAKHFKIRNRASPANLSVTIYANERATLLTRYPNMKSAKGVRVAVNKSTGFSELRGAFRIGGLRGSGADGIALRNKAAVEFFKRGASKGLRSPLKAAKLARLIAKAEQRPSGIFVLHARSVNQLFMTVRETVAPDINDFLLADFLQQYNRLKLR